MWLVYAATKFTANFIHSNARALSAHTRVCVNAHLSCCRTREVKMPCSEVAEAVSPQKRSRSHASEENAVLKFAKLTENATTPSRGSNRAAGFDLYRWHIHLLNCSACCVVTSWYRVCVTARMITVLDRWIKFWWRLIFKSRFLTVITAESVRVTSTLNVKLDVYVL